MYVRTHVKITRQRKSVLTPTLRFRAGKAARYRNTQGLTLSLALTVLYRGKKRLFCNKSTHYSLGPKLKFKAKVKLRCSKDPLILVSQLFIKWQLTDAVKNS